MSAENGHHGGYAQGRSHVWTAETVRDIQAKAELGRYQIRGFSTFHRFPTLDDLVFLPAATPGPSSAEGGPTSWHARSSSTSRSTSRR